ncbi:SWIM zinc finger family protein [Desertibacillus haloalkaliphilus]|uniref:SWIM zinc finger family protein n=1 Tax=Desertibacillus haloalkaliphilus TaxID=1328930 RepID=UPI001C2737A2|nr:SWIM zinc finger family protein [Desertibacillus haloalkaliphilus]MBU8908360.1 SWIM zinc finger family protein [Desertibacillus haloalkaliphilus]
MTNLTFSSEQLHTFIHDHVVSHIATRGVNYYKKGNVADIKVTSAEVLEATVHGSSIYTVEVHLDDLTESTCTCPYHDYCKHLVAALFYIEEHRYRVQEQLEEYKNRTVTLVIEQHKPKDIEEQLQSHLDSIIITSYRSLTTAGYFHDDHLKQIVERCIRATAQNYSNEEHVRERLICVNVMIHGLFALGRKFNTYHTYERRFTRFFSQLINESEPFIVECQRRDDSDFYLWFTETLIHRYFLSNDVKQSPWHLLLIKWLTHDSNQARKLEVLNLFITEQKRSPNNESLTMLASILALDCENGALSLSLLRKMKHSLTPNDLIHHFQLLERRQDWDLIKNWFDLFLTFWKNKSLGSLEPIYERMLMNTGNEKEQIILLWNAWLQSPSYSTYLQRMKDFADYKEEALDYILPRLEEQLYVPKIEQLYYKILLNEGQTKKAIARLLTNETEPSLLSDEKKQVINYAKKSAPEQLLPLYHQFIVRLIEKKSRSHYEQAVSHMKELQLIYEQLGLSDRFHSYISQLRTKYKTYRALLQEMKKIVQ